MTRTVPAHGGQLEALARRFAIDVRGLLDFSANINPEGPPTGVVEALRTALDGDTVLNSYPDLEQRDLRIAIALHVGVETEQIAIANGVIPLLEATLRAVRVQRCLLPVPSFSEYRTTLERAGVVVTPHTLPVQDGFRYQRKALLDALTHGGHDTLLLANPQNPSGTLCPREDLLELVEEAGRRNVHVLLDEAFIDYAPAHSLCDMVERIPHLTVFRSLTKFYSVPGLRIAYAVAHAPQAHAIAQQIAAWPVTTLASIGVRAALADTAYAESSLALNEARRARLLHGMDALGLPSYAPAANFLLLRIRGDATACWERLIVDHGIVLRNCANFEALPPNHLRCLVRADPDNERLLRALAT